jgi:hypothetical protein
MAAYIDWKRMAISSFAIWPQAQRATSQETIHDDEAKSRGSPPDSKRILFILVGYSRARLTISATIGPGGSDMKTVYRSPKTGTTLWRRCGPRTARRF